jgi:HEPN domain-containing protein
MTPDPNELGTSYDWLRRAKSNLIRARQPKPEDVLWEDLCFDTQQAAEKALKAVLVARRIPFRFVHDIAELLTLLENQGIILPEEIKASAGLTDYSVESRYPGPFEPITEEEFEKALQIAEAVVTWAELQIEKK